jgi:hypothetical protein
VWACDILPVIDLFFRQVFFIIELGWHRVVHFHIYHAQRDAEKPFQMARMSFSTNTGVLRIGF